MATDMQTKPSGADKEYRPLPQGVGQLGPAWMAFVVASSLVLLIGLFAWWQELSEGMIVTGMRNVGTMGGASWGLYITMVVYFIGVSFAGITIAALIRLFRIDYLRPIARSAELLTVVALILGALAIVVDLGQPLRGIVNLFRYARPQSPFFGTFSLVIAGYLFASLVYLYLGGRRDAAILAKQRSGLQWFHRLWAAGYTDTPAEQERHRNASFWLALAIIPLLVIAHSTLGFVFGLQVGRPGWYGTLQAPAFLALAGVSGIGHVIVLAAVVRRIIDDQARIGSAIFAWLGKFLLLLLLVYLYFMTVELLTLLYATPEVEKELSDALLLGSYAWLYWGSVALLVLPAISLIWQALAHRWSVKWLVAAGIAVNLAAIGKRYLIVVPSQTHGTLLPYETGSYSPSWVEYATVLGMFALGALLVGLFYKVFPALPLSEEEEKEVVSHA
ncbi:MAG TPA: NrfD/PsrC family molybdoenzyme membrane anchor subunit [Acidimicrobiia bacterium]|jgi:molybdopterin-containing oxidoreductase family membrane subunit|nr:NrfD/PsrC family molybdoenzyme membrane anchor subunit [Acidimicrobiia bacterium]